MTQEEERLAKMLTLPHEELAWGLKEALKGVTVLEKPRVSKKVLLAAVRGQNSIMSELLADMKEAKQEIKILKEARMRMQEEQDKLILTVKQHEDTINEQRDTIEELDQSMQIFREKIDLVDAMEARVNEHSQDIASITSKVDDLFTFKEEVSNELAYNKDFRENVLEHLDKIEDNIKDLPNTIKISSEQVMCTAMSFEKEDPTLTQTLVNINNTLADNENDLDELKKNLKEHWKFLINKADISYETKVDDLTYVVEKIKAKQDEQDGVDITDVRRRLDELVNTVDEINQELVLKINDEDVDERIEDKYEEIVNHLHHALKAAAVDEEELKKISSDLNNAMEELKDNKADKREIQFINDRLLRIQEAEGVREAEMIHMVKQSADMIKAELESELNTKISQTDFDEALQNVVDKISTVTQLAEEGALGGQGNGKNGISNQWKGLADSLEKGLDSDYMRPPPGSTLATTQSALHAQRAMTQPGPGIVTCLSCHTPIINIGKDKIFAGSSYGGGFQVFGPNSSKGQGPPLRTGLAKSIEHLPETREKNERYLQGIDGGIYLGDKSGKIVSEQHYSSAFKLPTVVDIGENSDLINEMGVVEDQVNNSTNKGEIESESLVSGS